MFKIVLVASAKKDMAEIKHYISDVLQNPSAANHMLSAIIKRLALLPASPEQGPILVRPDARLTGYRYIIVKNYVVFYRIESHTIYVDRIIHARRDYMSLLFGAVAEDETDYEN